MFSGLFVNGKLTDYLPFVHRIYSVQTVWTIPLLKTYSYYTYISTKATMISLLILYILVAKGERVNVACAQNNTLNKQTNQK